jgi:hypothetical protein
MATHTTQRICPICNEAYWNQGAHMEACPGRRTRGEFLGYQCSRCGHLHQNGTFYCWCGGTKRPVWKPL